MDVTVCSRKSKQYVDQARRLRLAHSGGLAPEAHCQE